MTGPPIYIHAITFLIILITSVPIPGQSVDSVSMNKISALIQLDSIVVLASRYDFEVRDFMNMVLEDESFYEAFKRLRRSEYIATVNMQFYRKNSRVQARQQVTFSQKYKENCPFFSIDERTVEGNLYKSNGEYRYMTASLFDHLFFRPGPCNTQRSKLENRNKEDTSNKVNTRSSQLRHLMFEPGKQANIPLIGNKLDIFSEEMHSRYDYHIQFDTIENRGSVIEETYLFSARAKPAFIDKKEGKTVIKSLNTWFDIDTKQVLRREYEIDYDPIFVSCIAKIRMDLMQVGSELLPVFLSYEGDWNLPFKKREIGSFQVKFEYK